MNIERGKDSTPLCRHYIRGTEGRRCEIKMDLTFCGKNCPYNTSESGTYITDRYGNVIGMRKI